MRVEGYLWAGTPLWMWEDAIAEQIVAVQEFWLGLGYLFGTRDNKPHYGVVFTDWPQLAREVKRHPVLDGQVLPYYAGEPWAARVSGARETIT